MTDELLYIAEGLRGLTVPIDELHVDPANARTGHALERIAASLKAYGQRKPIIANQLQDGKIEAGNGTWQAAKHLGWSHIAVVFVEDDPATAAAFGIADNRLSDLSTWDLDALGALMPTVEDLMTGFTESEIRDVLGERGGGLMGGEEWPVIDSELRKIGFHWSSTIIWVKDQMVLSRKDYHGQYEPIWYGWKNDASRVCEVPDRKQSDTWFIDRPRKSEEHPTMKPLELVERSLTNSSQPGSIVLDLFAGSGTTLMACERLGRVCRTMDNDPKYVSVVLERWSIATGKIPVLEES